MTKEYEKIEQAYISMIQERGIECITRKKLCDRLDIDTDTFRDTVPMTFHAFKQKISLRYFLDIAMCFSIIDGYDSITLEQIGEGSKTKTNTIRKYFGSVQNLRCRVLLHAIEKQNVQIIVAAIGKGDPLVSDISIELREKVCDYIRKQL